MKPLLDEDAEGSSNECNEETQDPEGIDSRRNSRCLERWNAENWDGRVDEVPVDGEVGCLVDELYEENIGEVFRLLLEAFIRLDNKRGDDRREQTSLFRLDSEL